MNISKPVGPVDGGNLAVSNESSSQSGTMGATRKGTISKTILSLTVALVAILILAACGSSDSTESSSGTAGLKEAPKFVFNLYQGEDVLGGSEFNLADLQGKPLVLNFWAGLCPPCRAEMPDLQEFYDEFSDRVVLFGLDVGPFTGLGSNQSGVELIEDLGITYPAGTTTQESVVRDYKVLGMPSTVFITSDGKIFRNWTGILNRDKLAEITEAMLQLSG